MRVYNFSAGPAALPLEVLEQAQKEFLDYNGTGMSITEMSHRSKAFMALNEEARILLRELMKIPDGYDVLFVQGGASQQFAAVPLNLMKTGKADCPVRILPEFNGRPMRLIFGCLIPRSLHSLLRI